MNLTKIAGLVALVAICCTLSACGTVRYRNNHSVKHAKKHGPPPHAPAHGYHHKHGNVALEFDSALEVYLVSGHSNYYFHDKYYYWATRCGGQITANCGGPWKAVSSKKLPKGLRNSAHAKKHKKHKNKKNK